MTRASTWSNPDGLVVGFGPNFPERNVGGVVDTPGFVKEAVLQFTFESSSPNISLPANSVIHDVFLVVGTAWVGGTDVQVGDGGDPDGFISASQGATANLTAGKMIRGGGAYMVADTDTTAQELPKVYTSADTVDVAFTGTFTAGTASLVVRYSAKAA